MLKASCTFEGISVCVLRPRRTAATCFALEDGGDNQCKDMPSDVIGI
jgi:hypothetical protein